MIRLILIVITVANAGRYSAAVATSDVGDIVYDITESICKMSFLEQALLYLRFCADDGFKKCGKLLIKYLNYYVYKLAIG